MHELLFDCEYFFVKLLYDKLEEEIKQRQKEQEEQNKQQEMEYNKYQQMYNQNMNNNGLNTLSLPPM